MTKLLQTPKIPIHRLDQLLKDPQNNLNPDCPFVLPVWLDNWHNTLGYGQIPYLLMLHKGNTIFGIAPLVLIKTNYVVFFGIESVCDF
jgi:hypothetical protein